MFAVLFLKASWLCPDFQDMLWVTSQCYSSFSTCQVVLCHVMGLSLVFPPPSLRLAQGPVRLCPLLLFFFFMERFIFHAEYKYISAFMGNLGAKDWQDLGNLFCFYGRLSIFLCGCIAFVWIVAAHFPCSSFHIITMSHSVGILRAVNFRAKMEELIPSSKILKKLSHKYPLEVYILYFWTFKTNQLKEVFNKRLDSYLFRMEKDHLPWARD